MDYYKKYLKYKSKYLELKGGSDNLNIKQTENILSKLSYEPRLDMTLQKVERQVRQTKLQDIKDKYNYKKATQAMYLLNIEQQYKPEQYQIIKNPENINTGQFLKDNFVSNDTKHMKIIKDASVLIADYNQLKEDFDFFKNKSNNDIDEYLLSHVAVFSDKYPDIYREQFQNYVPVNHTKQPDSCRFYRPQNYGRAVVFRDMKNNIQMDIKGVGRGRYYKHIIGDKPKESDKSPMLGNSHSDGLLSIHNSIGEYFGERVLRLATDTNPIFKYLNVHTIRSYGIISLNLIISGLNHTASLYLRQSSLRNIDQLQEQDKFYFQNSLSWFGISSYDSNGSRLMINKNLNIQTNININIQRNQFEELYSSKIESINDKNINYISIFNPKYTNNERHPSFILDFGHYYFLDEANFENIYVDFLKNSILEKATYKIVEIFIKNNTLIDYSKYSIDNNYSFLDGILNFFKLNVVSQNTIKLIQSFQETNIRLISEFKDLDLKVSKSKKDKKQTLEKIKSEYKKFIKKILTLILKIYYRNDLKRIFDVIMEQTLNYVSLKTNNSNWFKCPIIKYGDDSHLDYLLGYNYNDGDKLMDLIGIKNENQTDGINKTLFNQLIEKLYVNFYKRYNKCLSNFKENGNQLQNYIVNLKKNSGITNKILEEDKYYNSIIKDISIFFPLVNITQSNHGSKKLFIIITGLDGECNEFNDKVISISNFFQQQGHNILCIELKSQHLIFNYDYIVNIISNYINKLIDTNEYEMITFLTHSLGSYLTIDIINTNQTNMFNIIFIDPTTTDRIKYINDKQFNQQFKKIYKSNLELIITPDKQLLNTHKILVLTYIIIGEPISEENIQYKIDYYNKLFKNNKSIDIQQIHIEKEQIKLKGKTGNPHYLHLVKTKQVIDFIYKFIN